jgi:hypothetical protein
MARARPTTPEKESIDLVVRRSTVACFTDHVGQSSVKKATTIFFGHRNKKRFPLLEGEPDEHNEGAAHDLRT